MRALLLLSMTVLPLAGITLLFGPVPGEARDFGQAGQTFPVIEPDLLATIEARLKRAEASGELARMNEVFARRVEAKVRRPDPVTGISVTETPRTWTFDPSVAIGRDVRDQKGNLIAAAGQKVNPLDFVTVRQDLVFIDGDDAEQVAWATKKYSDLQAKIIFIKGSPIDQMTAKKRRFYFDQAGKLTSRFGIEHVPAVVAPAGKVMRVSEIVIGKRETG